MTKKMKVRDALDIGFQAMIQLYLSDSIDDIDSEMTYDGKNYKMNVQIKVTEL